MIDSPVLAHEEGVGVTGISNQYSLSDSAEMTTPGKCTFMI